ncbi:MAG: N-formylglutamate amidohydrolase, partial [Lysobacterales bacterium]
FAGLALYSAALEPGAREVRERRKRYWLPYHRCLHEELERIRQAHGHAVLLDAHSIRSTQPLLFDGVLPDLNLGSHGGKSAAGSLIGVALKALRSSPYSLVLDGRFKGGYITRHYGKPGFGCHALQLEMAQSIYMQEDPPVWHEERASALKAVLQNLVEALLHWTPADD